MSQAKQQAEKVAEEQASVSIGALDKLAKIVDINPAGLEKIIQGDFEATSKRHLSQAELAKFAAACAMWGLNPTLGEAYAFKKSDKAGGGIQVIVGKDGWYNLTNKQPSFDQHKYSYCYEANGEEVWAERPKPNSKLLAVECLIFRTDREHPSVATALLKEYKRNIATWSTYETTMLEHKAFIKAAKAAFGFAGIVDPDTAEAINVNVEEEPEPLPPAPTRDAVVDMMAEVPAPEPEPIPEDLPKKTKGPKTDKKREELLIHIGEFKDSGADLDAAMKELGVAGMDYKMLDNADLKSLLGIMSKAE